MPMFPKNLIYIALPIACHASIAGESLVYFQEAMKLIDVHNRKVLEVLDSLPNKYSHAQIQVNYYGNEQLAKTLRHPAFTAQL